ncbi:iron ABC transporter permease [Microbacterium sp. X-17]|uniref:ABC transporter permease n=1 Tax=Microbacterium sp. X-17 TaxID=3144404 RepID=UPI0031F4EA6A
MAGRLRAPRHRRPGVGLIVAAGAVTLLTLVPVGFVVGSVVTTGLVPTWELIARPRVVELLVNTVLLVAIAVPACVAVGVAGAWLVERSSLPGRRVATVVLVAPLAVPAFVASYAWVSAVPSINGLGAGVLISVLAYSPLVFLPCLAALRGLDPELEDTARALGLGEAHVFLRVVLPQLRVAISGGALLVGLHLLAEYGAFALIRFDTFTTAIMVQFQSTFAGPAANALGVVLTLLCLLLLAGDARLRGRLRLARIGSGVPRPALRTRLAPLGVAISLLFVAGYGLLGAGVPFVTITRWLLAGDGWAQRHLIQAVATTLGLAVAGAIVTTLAALPLAWLLVRYPGRLSRLTERANYLASSLPAIIIALAFVTVTLRIVPGLYQTLATVVVAYLVMFLPRALVSVRAGIAQAPERREEVARSLGVPPWLARLRVTLPIMAAPVLAGAALVGIGVANELTSTLLLAPNGTRTLATEFWSASSSVAYADAAPYAALLVAVSIPAVALMYAETRRRS